MKPRTYIEQLASEVGLTVAKRGAVGEYTFLDSNGKIVFVGEYMSMLSFVNGYRYRESLLTPKRVEFAHLAKDTDGLYPEAER